jgi:hypothetical protein
MNRLISVNPGLSSRFPDSITFSHLAPERCLELLTTILRKKKQLDISVIEPCSAEFEAQLLQYFNELSQLPSWGNARDVNQLVKSIYSSLLRRTKVTKDSPKLVITAEIISGEFESMILERHNRGKAALTVRKLPNQELQNMSKTKQATTHQAQPPATYASSTAITQANFSERLPHVTAEDIPPPPQSNYDTIRDAGVSDAIWESLQRDKLAEIQQQKAYEELLAKEQKTEKLFASEEEEAKAATTAEREQPAEDDEARRKYEEDRLRREERRRARAAELAELVRQRVKAEEERAREHEVQKKLQKLGVCPVGFRWIKNAGGYRCAGGSHFVSVAQLQ